MGWCFGWNSKSELRAHLLSSLQCPVVAHRTVGNHLYIVVETPDHDRGPRSIVVVLLQSDRRDGWGYKDMDEHMGPFYYDCPESLIALAGGVEHGNPAWRERVMAHHRRRKLDIPDGTKVAIGDEDYVVTGRYNRSRVYWLVRRRSDGRLFKAKTEQMTLPPELAA